VVFGEGAAIDGMGDDSIWLQMSTVGVGETEEMARRARDAGVTFVDAPVLGTKQPAEQGKLVVLAASPAAVLETCEPVFDAVGTKVITFDEPGQATRLKLVLNNWVLAVTVGTAETSPSRSVWASTRGCSSRRSRAGTSTPRTPR
jgi:3-hydroxyisobutyrate dehydrogenase